MGADVESRNNDALPIGLKRYFRARDDAPLLQPRTEKFQRMAVRRYSRDTPLPLELVPEGELWNVSDARWLRLARHESPASEGEGTLAVLTKLLLECGGEGKRLIER